MCLFVSTKAFAFYFHVISIHYFLFAFIIIFIIIGGGGVVVVISAGTRTIKKKHEQLPEKSRLTILHLHFIRR